MARYNKNMFSDGLHGSFGHQFYFRVVNGVTYISSMPKKKERKNKEPGTPERQNFHKATRYAKRVMSDPELRKIYEEFKTGFLNPHNLAIGDFLKAPEITLIYTRFYKGKPGNIISTRVKNIIPVATVSMQILLPDGSVLEEGLAKPGNPPENWEYTATTPCLSVKGCTIRVTATDHPGNQTIKKMILD